MKHAELSLLALLALSCSATAQTNVNWGLQTGAEPRAMGVYDTSHTFVPTGNLNSSAHTWAPTGDGSAITVLVGGSIPRSLANRFGETIDLLDYATGVVQGNGVVDDGPMFRAALAACTAGNGFRRLHVPQPSSVWSINSLDPSGLGGLVIGNGTTNPSCWLDGDAPNTLGGYLGGVNIKLGPALNRPLVYVQSAAGSPIFSNMRLDGNKTAQTGWSGGPGGKLFAFQIADDASGGTAGESAAIFSNVWIMAGYNGNLYQGWGRGTLWSQNLWLMYSGQTSADFSYATYGYDATHLNLQVGENVGGGVLLSFGGQYQLKGGAVFGNSADGITVNGSQITYSDIEGVNVQYNGCNGITVRSTASLGGEIAEGHTYRGVVFDSNSHTTTQTCSDFNNLGSTIESLVSPVFGGASGATAPVPLYNVYNASGAKTAVLGPIFGNGGTSATPTFTNDFTKVVLNQFGEVNIGNVAPTNSGFMFSVNDTRQFYGQLWTNGTNVFASIGGTTSTNDGGLLKLMNGGATGVNLIAAGNSYIVGNTGFGGQTAPAYPVDVTGTANATTLRGANLTVQNATQYTGASFSNGTNIFAKIFGDSPTNDNGTLQLFSAGTPKVQISADSSAFNYFFWNTGFGGQTSPAYPVDVTGQIHSTLGYVGPAYLTTGSTVNSAPIAGTSGTLTNGHCVSINSLGLFVDAGGACTVGGGGGTVAAGTPGQLAVYTAPTTVGSFALAGDCAFSSGALTCTKTGGVPLGALAVLNTVPAATPTVVGGVTAQSSYAAGVGLGSAANGNTVPTNAALAATDSARSPVVRTGYYAVGDSPAVTYVASGSACSLFGGMGDHGSQIPTSDGKCWLAQWAGAADLTDFGAVAGASDNYYSIYNWLQLAGTVKLTAPCGTFDFKYPLVAAATATNNMNIQGCGIYGTTFNYTGTSSTVDLLTIGNGSNDSFGATIENIRVTTSQTMASPSTAIRLRHLGESHLRNIAVAGLDLQGTARPWNGIWFDGAHEVFVDGYEVAICSNDGIIVTGPDGTSNADLYLNHGYSDFNLVSGVHMAGGFGGLFIDGSEFLANGAYQILLDNALVNISNRELILGTTAMVDGTHTTNYGLYVNDTAGTGVDYIIASGILGSSVLDGVYIKSWPYGRVILTGSVFNNQRDGLRVDDASAWIAVSGMLTYNTGWGINATTPTNNITFNGGTNYNILGDFSPNTGLGVQTLSSSSVGSANAAVAGNVYTWSGAITSATSTLVYDKVTQHLTQFKLTINITNAGTGAGGVYYTLPFASTINSTLGSCNYIASGTNGTPIGSNAYAGNALVSLPGAAATASVINCSGFIYN